MKIKEVSVRDFRENQKDYFEKADRGEKFVIKRKKQYYALIAVQDDDINLSFSPVLNDKLSQITKESNAK